MGTHTLISKFRDAAEEWGKRTGHGSDTIVFYGMVHTGGIYYFDSVGKADTTGMSKEQIDRMSIGELQGHHTLDQLVTHLETLVERQHFGEELLITGLIRLIDDEFEDLAENYARGLQANRERADKMREMAGDPEFVEAWEARLGERGEPGSGAARLLEMAAFSEKMSLGSPKDLRDRVQSRDRWREVTAELMSEAFRKEWREASMFRV